MRTKIVRVEQAQADLVVVDKALNEAIAELEKGGHSVRDVRVAVGRDADAGSGLEKRFAVTFVLLYE